MVTAQGLYWTADFGEIAEAEQFRVGSVGDDLYSAYFPIGQLQDLITSLTNVIPLGLDVLSLGTQVQSRKVSTGFHTEVVIEPRSDTFPPQIMRAELTTLSDLISVLSSLQALIAGQEPADWDGSKIKPISYSALPPELSPEQLTATIVGVVDPAVAPKIDAGSVAPTVYPSGRRWLFLGDSHTDGAGATNVTFAYALYTSRVAGSEAVTVVRRGYPGETSSQLLDRLPGLIGGDAPEGVFVMCGTNDASTPFTSELFISNIAAMKALADNARIPFVVSTVPPRASTVTDAAIRRDAVRAYNQQLYRWATDKAVPLVDVFGAVVDPATGYMASAYDSGDGVHFNNAGHLQIATVVAPVVAKTVHLGPWPVQAKGVGLLANPLNDPAGGGWTVISGSASGTFQDPVAGDGLTRGKWCRLAIDNSGGGTTATGVWGHTIAMSNVSVGDTLVAFFKLKAAGGASVSARWLQSATSIAIPVDGTGVDVPYSGFISARTITTEDKASVFRFGFSVTCPAGVNGSASIGQLDVFNLTTGDMVGLY